MKIIHNVKPAVVMAFFGKNVQKYDYYEGIIVVSDELGEKWNAGMNACYQQKVDTQSKEGYRIRLKIMGRSETALDSYFQKPTAQDHRQRIPIRR